MAEGTVLGRDDSTAPASPDSDECEEGWRLLETKNFEDALARFNRALRADPDNVHALSGKLGALRLLGSFRPAEALINSVPAEVADEEWLFQQGLFYLDYKRHAEAIALFGKTNTEEGKEWESVAVSDRLRLQHRFDEAEDAITQGLEEREDSPDLLNQRGLLYYDYQNYPDAIEQFKKAGNDFARTWRAIAESTLCRRRRDFAAARNAIASIPTLRKEENPSLLTEEGWIRLDEALDETAGDARPGQPSVVKAEQAFERAIRLAPEQVYLRLNLVQLYLYTHRADEGREMLEKLVCERPDDHALRECLGWIYIEERDLARARSEFEAICEKEPSNIGGMIGGAACDFHDGDFVTAAKTFGEAYHLASKDPLIATKLAWAKLLQNDPAQFDEVESLCRTAIGTDPFRAQAYGCLGILASKRGQVRRAEAKFLKSIEVNPRRGSYSDLAALYGKMGRYADAEQQLKKALRWSPYDSRALVHLGKLHLEMGRSKEGIDELRQAVALDPGDVDAAVALAEGLICANSIHEATESLHLACGRLDGHRLWPVHLASCRLLVRRGDEIEEERFYTEALVQVRRAWALSPGNAEVFFCQGVVEAKRHNYRSAKKAFTQAAKLDAESAARDSRASDAIVAQAVDPRRVLRQAETENYVNKVKDLAKMENVSSVNTRWATVIILTVVLVQLVALWVLHELGRVKDPLLSLMLPILFGLVVIAFLLPYLTKLKMPGLEADLQPPLVSRSVGPTGEIGFSGQSPSMGADSR